MDYMEKEMLKAQTLIEALPFIQKFNGKKDCCQVWAEAQCWMKI